MFIGLFILGVIFVVTPILQWTGLVGPLGTLFSIPAIFACFGLIHFNTYRIFKNKLQIFLGVLNILVGVWMCTFIRMNYMDLIR